MVRFRLYNPAMTQSLHQPPKRMTFAEYVERELQSDVRSEYHGGEVFEMSGGTIDHSRIIRNLSGELRTLLRNKPCESFEANLRLYVHAFDRGFYPDNQVICGPIEYLEGDRSRTTVVNPAVVFEVLSPGTFEYDKGDKLRAYLSIPSLKQYVLVESTLAYVEVLTRREDGWLRTDATGLEASLKLAALDVELKLSELYLGVTFPAPVKRDDTPPAR
jgi:Uma2 family endonuclease